MKQPGSFTVLLQRAIAATQDWWWLCIWLAGVLAGVNLIVGVVFRVSQWFLLYTVAVIEETQGIEEDI